MHRFADDLPRAAPMDRAPRALPRRALGRYALPLIFLLLACSWVVTDHIWSPALVPELAEGVFELGLVVLVAAAWITFDLRHDRARWRATSALLASEERFRQVLANVDRHAVTLDAAGRITFANEALVRTIGNGAPEMIGRDWHETCVPADRRAEERGRFDQMISSGVPLPRDEGEILTSGGERRLISWTNELLRDASGTIVGAARVGEDVTAHRQVESERNRLAAAVDQATDSVVIADADGRIVYANPAHDRVSRLRVGDVLGPSGRQAAASAEIPAGPYRSVRRALRRGRVWRGEWTAIRPDGSPYTAEVTASPIRDASGGVTHFISISRDVTELRRLRAELTMVAQIRVAIGQSLRRIQPDAPIEETAREICDELLNLPGIDFAGIVSFLGADAATVLALNAPAGFPLKPGDPLPASRARYQYQRAQEGPWAEAWRVRPEDGEYGRQVAWSGLKAIAYGPIVSGGTSVGLIAVGTTDEAVAPRVVEHLPAIAEFGATTSALLAQTLDVRRRQAELREQIAATIATSAFSPVFQPVVDLGSGQPVGWEALTRFADGTRPDLAFEAARSVGLGLELEAATLAAAVSTARGLPGDGWLSLNVSPALITAGGRLASLLAGRRQPIVLEITEHEVIDDYGVVRAALQLLGPEVRLAVDDAGAGVANFTHIVELRPDFVKLDRSLIRDVNADLTRQALVVGLRHFAMMSGCQTIAEGVETAEELAALAALDVPLGQGYVLARPVPLESILGRVGTGDADSTGDAG